MDWIELSVYGITEEINMVMADNWELVGVHTGLLEATVNFGASVFLAEQEIAKKEGEENA